MAMATASTYAHRHTQRLRKLTTVFVVLLSSFSHATVSIVRSVESTSEVVVDSNGQTSLIPSTPEWCQLETDRTITISHPQSIDKGDRFYGIGSLSLEAVTMVLDYINTDRCGVMLNGKNYSITLHTYGDHSDKQRHQAIGYHIVSNSTNPRTDFMIGGYSSGLTRMIAPIAQEHNKVLVAGGSAQTDVFENRSNVFGILPPSPLVVTSGIAGVAGKGAKTVASVTEDEVGTCASLPALAQIYRMDLLASAEIPSNPDASHFAEVARNMSKLDPDVMVTCVRDCVKWVEAMRNEGWSPRAQIFTVCVGTPDLEIALGEDISYMMGASAWNRVLPPAPDVVTGWTPGEFANLFEAYTYQNATTQHAAAATSLTSLVYAIEKSNSLDPTVIAQTLQNSRFPTLFGETSFDENGQNQAASLLLQYDASGDLHVVYPPDKQSSESMEIVYPMPTWEQRDCLTKSTCEATGGVCQQNGTCGCNLANLDNAITWTLVSIGSGSAAACKLMPEENMNYMQDWWVSIGILLVVLQYTFAILFSIWTFCYREHPIIKASQHQFLLMVAFGCCVMVTTIIPMFAQGGYRHIQDPLTGQETDIPNPEVAGLDAACMARPWLASLGFTIIFSALFAKIWRVKKLLENAERFRRKKVEIKDVIIIMVVLLAFNSAVLLTWSLVDPLQWNRTVLAEDADGYPIESAGSCNSDSTIYFLSTLAVFKGGCLLYALYLCWITRRIHSDFQEGRWIFLCVYSIFQYLIIGIPVLVIASDDRDATFFVMAVGLFLVSSTVTFLIFGPKVWRFIWMDPNSPMDMSISVRKSAVRASTNRYSTTIPNQSMALPNTSQAEDFSRRRANESITGGVRKNKNGSKEVSFQISSTGEFDDEVGSSDDMIPMPPVFALQGGATEAVLDTHKEQAPADPQA